MIISHYIIRTDTAVTLIIIRIEIAFSTSRVSLVTRHTSRKIRHVFPTKSIPTFTESIRTVDKVQTFNLFTVFVTIGVKEIVANRLVDLKWMIVVSINYKLIFLKTSVTEVIVISIIIANLITVNPIASMIVRRVHLISPPFIVSRVCMSMEFRSMSDT